MNITSNINLKAVLWDMDGTLADTGELHFLTWKHALADLGYELSFDKFKATFGMNNQGILETLLGETPTPDLVARISDQKEGEYRILLRGNISLLPGVKDWLDWLHEHDIPQAVASSAPPENIDAFVEELHLRPYFDTLVSGFDMPGKPNPDIFLLAAKRLGMAAENCLVIEDAIAGVEAAQRAGMTCLAVTTTNPREALTHACRVVDTLEEVHPWEIINHRES
jgi:beta-phosphoglucomutase